MARKDIPFTAEHFVEFCKSFLGMPYWYGTVVYKCTESRLTSKAKQYPAHYSSSRMSKYRDAIRRKLVCADCVGLVKGYMWTGGGKGVIESIGTDKSFDNKYASHGCPDKSANGMFSYAKSKGCEWGTIKTLPEIPGLALRFDGHIGYYIGNGYAIEERGFAYGCVKTKVKDRPWTHWYKLPFIDYSAAREEEPEKTTYTLGDRALKADMVGTDVSILQGILKKLGYYDGAICGEYTIETAAAVKEFKEDHGVFNSEGVANSTYGIRAHEALMEALSENERGDEPAPEKKTVRITGSGTWNVRKGAGTQFGIMTVVKSGDEFEYIATASNGWIGIVIGDGQGWVSPKCAEVVG